MNMKRVLGILVLLCLTASLFALDGTVMSVKGKVEIQKGSTWKALAKGDVVKKGDVISSGFKSEAVIKLGESTLTLKPLSRLTLEQLADIGGNHKTQVYLDVGSIKANVKATKDRKVGFTVKSPVATASVRGTDFEMSRKRLRVNSGDVVMTRPLPKAIAGEEKPGKNDNVEQDALNTNGAGPEIHAKAGQGVVINNNGHFDSPQVVAVNNAAGNKGNTMSFSQSEKINDMGNKPSSILNRVPVGANATPNKRTGFVNIQIQWPEQ